MGLGNRGLSLGLDAKRAMHDTRVISRKKRIFIALGTQLFYFKVEKRTQSQGRNFFAAPNEEAVMNAETAVANASWSSLAYQYMPTSDEEFLKELNCTHLQLVSEEKLASWLKYKLASVLSVEELEDVEDFALRCRRSIQG